VRLVVLGARRNIDQQRVLAIEQARDRGRRGVLPAAAQAHDLGHDQGQDQGREGRQQQTMLGGERGQVVQKLVHRGHSAKAVGRPLSARRAARARTRGAPPSARRAAAPARHRARQECPLLPVIPAKAGPDSR